MTRSFAGQEIFNQNSYINSMKRASRIMRGFQPYLLTVNGGDDEAAFLARFAGLNEDDKATEENLSAALSSLLWKCMEIREDFLAASADGSLDDETKFQNLCARSMLKVIGRSPRETA